MNWIKKEIERLEIEKEYLLEMISKKPKLQHGKTVLNNTILVLETLKKVQVDIQAKKKEFYFNCLVNKKGLYCSCCMRTKVLFKEIFGEVKE